MAIFLTVAAAKAHLRENVDDADPDLLSKIDAAEAVILDYLKKSEVGRTNVADWTEVDDLPSNVRAAMLLQLGELWRFRGDDPGPMSPAREDGSDLSPVIVRLLRRYTDPVLA